jgi:cytochrome b6-f complex iron-sulfur subunit
MNRRFRKYHRWIAIILCLPLFITVLTGMGASIAGEWFGQAEFSEVLLSIHTFRILKMDAIFPVLNGLGLLGLLITGVSMTGLFRQHSQVR